MATTKKKATTSKKSTTKTSATKASTTSKRSSGNVPQRVKSAGWLAILESIIIGALGVALIWRPEEMMMVIFYVVGIFLMVKGIYKIINYFAVRGKYDFYNNDLLYGIIALVFGVIAVVLWEQLSGAIGIVVGAWMIYGALVRMNTAIKMHAAGVKEWFYILLLALVMLALGIYLIVSVGAVLVVVGWVMLAAAIISIIDDAIFMRHLDAITR